MCFGHWVSVLQVSEEQTSLQQRADEQRALHEQRLAEIRVHNNQLEKQREGKLLLDHRIRLRKMW